jgi:putative FmdB family regulatory protein
MPTYEYRCSDCGHQFETHRRIDEEPLTVCERCGGRLRKVFHPAGIVFKGSGFYATDSRSKRSGSKDGGDSKKSDAKSESSSSSEAKSDSTSGSGGDGGGKKESSSSGKSDSKKPSGSGSST